MTTTTNTNTINTTNNSTHPDWVIDFNRNQLLRIREFIRTEIKMRHEMFEKYCGEDLYSKVPTCVKEGFTDLVDGWETDVIHPIVSEEPFEMDFSKKRIVNKLDKLTCIVSDTVIFGSVLNDSLDNRILDGEFDDELEVLSEIRKDQKMKLRHMIKDDVFDGVMETVYEEFDGQEDKLNQILDMDVSKIGNGLIELLEKFRDVKDEYEESDLTNQIHSCLFEMGGI